MRQPTPDYPTEKLPNAWSTNVLFPRFEHEAADGTVTDVAHPRQWLVDEACGRLITPTQVTAQYRYSKTGEWIGVAHHWVEQITPTSVVQINNQAVQARARVLHHSYMYDQQCLEGRAQEIVLEQFEEGQFVDIAALLIRRHHESLFRYHYRQFLVERTEDGSHWREPANPDHHSQALLQAMMRLCGVTQQPVIAAQ